jgi:hypothetical protein
MLELIKRLVLMAEIQVLFLVIEIFLYLIYIWFQSTVVLALSWYYTRIIMLFVS